MTTRDAFEANRFDEDMARDDDDTKRDDKMTEANVFKATAFDERTTCDAFNPKRFDETIARDNFGTKSVDERPLPTGTTSIRLKNGHSLIDLWTERVGNGTDAESGQCRMDDQMSFVRR